MHRAILRISTLIVVIGMLLGAACPTQAAYETGGVVKVILSNGLTLLVRPEPEASVAAIEVFVRVGAPDEHELNAGIGQLLAGSILAGTKSRSASKLAKLISEVGGNFHAVWQWNYLEVYAVTPPQTCEETLGLLADSILNSKLDAAAVEYSRAAILREARRQEEDPFNCAYTALRRLVRPGTPYDRSYLGDPEKIKEISQQELAKFYEDHFSADRIVISVVGNVDAERVMRKVEKYFGNMKHSARSPEGKADVRPGTGKLTIEMAGSSAYVLLGYPAPGVDDPDYPAMCVANVLLGGNKSSLLFTKLREERGLGYQVGSVYPALRLGSHIAAYLGMDSARATPEAISAVQEAMLEQADVLRSGRFTNDDLERAKRFLIGNHALQHERTRDRAYHLGWHEVMGLGYQYDFQYPGNIRRVTRKDAERVCNRFLCEPTWVILLGTQNGERVPE